ncbi:hypothetical protein J3A83DRAFT_4184689 [Scleroderma citrinum]
MPRNLPGMYWDEERKRYFPLSSAPPHYKERADCTRFPHPEAQQEVTYSEGEKNTTSCIRDAPHQILAHLRSTFSTTQKDRLTHRLRCSQFTLTDKVERSDIPFVSPRGHITAFQWSRMAFFRGFIRVVLFVSSICVDDSKCIIDSRIACDVWTADLQGSRLILGANKQAVCIDDISERAAVYPLPTGSDVFAVAQQEQIIYTGLRNGSILRFDNRLWKPRGDALLDGLFTQSSNSVTNLRLLRDSQLLVVNIDGSISIFDLRFLTSRTPFKILTGNVNSYFIKMPIAVDSSEEVLFAAGQDSRIRLWSLRSGGPPLTPSSNVTIPKPYRRDLLEYQFEHPVRSMQLSEDENGMNLWAASGYDLFKYSLGQRIS